MRPVRLLVVVMVVAWAAALWAQAATRETPSTPQERKRAIELTRKLERDPLGEQATQDRQWLTQWIIEIPDLTVPVCDEVLRPVLVGEMGQYRYAKELLAQQMAGGMAYIIQHPQPAEADQQDDLAINRAGLTSALNAYESLVRTNARGAKWGPLEKLAEQRKGGTLEDYIRQATMRCMTGDTITAGLRGATPRIMPAVARGCR